MSRAQPLIEKRLATTSYKHMWARHVARKTLYEDLQVALDRVSKIQAAQPTLPIEEVGPKENISDLLEKTKQVTGTGFIPDSSTPGRLTVGIVGAGVAGLFTALLFDWLNEDAKKQGLKLKIDYDIIEAAGKDRLGGRLYTHKFSEEDHDYYDVGAMRFPNNSIMKRTFQLFDYIGLEKGEGGLIRYYLDDDLEVCPSYFNNVRHTGNPWPGNKESKNGTNVAEAKADDPFNLNSGLPEDGKIPLNLLRKNPSTLVSEALKTFLEVAKTQGDKARKEKAEETGATVEATKFWKLLMRADHMSVRQFLSSGINKAPVTTEGEEDPFPNGPGFNYNTIEWLETATFGTGWYDQSLAESVLEELDFGTPDPVEGEPKLHYWWCVDGGAQRIAEKMALKIKGKIQFNSQVEAIDAQVKDRPVEKTDKKDKNKYTAMKLRIAKTDSITKKKTQKEKDYFAIFNSTTLGAFQRMNLQDAGLLWGTKQAIRALGYGASCKVAIKFKTAWWQKEPFNISQGGVSRTDLPLRVCVYPSYNIKSNEGNQWDPEKPAVLLCSYTWGQDAQRIGSLISPDSPENEEQLKSVLLDNLALLHANEKRPYKELLEELKNEQYETHHAWDWYKDQNMSGAFAYFGPSQFSNMWQEITKPNAFGQLYFVGEAASSHHAWIVGALESVIRAVYTMFEGLESNDKENKAYRRVLALLSGAVQVDASDEDSSSPSDYSGDAPFPTGLPFYPLPEEMPSRQLGVERGHELTRQPEEGTKETDKSLTFTSAVAALAVIESYFELHPELAAAA
ncbi:hypothetical protein B0J13DRAFT_63603 [Dactylonectria estremocensis]|uniref:Amine oxidase domain-containing protein n=1 Tax=Dactylonectria estremocensis TaxID=1079267 RepID=A0A9P9ENL2_9HYPO|nr:hypothetical protein B0J13DRAFT_63603 [Dactylonectria estremocensis]